MTEQQPLAEKSLQPVSPGAGHELRWTYVLALIPALTELVETSRLPVTPHEWITEVVAGLIIVALVYQVRRRHAEILALARFDTLTGLLNRRVFQESVVDECARARRLKQPLSLIYMDLDHFKQVNDQAGHGAGDRVLTQLAAAIRDTIRARIDHGFRLGGDEFALLLPSTPALEAERVAVRIGEHCSRSDRVWVNGPLGISAGIVELDPNESPAVFIERADAAMYLKKRARSSEAAVSTERHDHRP